MRRIVLVASCGIGAVGLSVVGLAVSNPAHWPLSEWPLNLLAPGGLILGTIGLAALPWGIFYLVRWIAYGFRG